MITVYKQRPGLCLRFTHCCSSLPSVAAGPQLQRPNPGAQDVRADQKRVLQGTDGRREIHALPADGLQQGGIPVRPELRSTPTNHQQNRVICSI